MKKTDKSSPQRIAIRENIRELRKTSGKTGEEIAEVLGITQSAYTKKETGNNEFTITEIVRLSEYYNEPGNNKTGHPIDCHWILTGQIREDIPANRATGLSSKAIEAVRTGAGEYTTGGDMSVADPASVVMLDALLQSGQFWVALQDMSDAASRPRFKDIIDNPELFVLLEKNGLSWNVIADLEKTVNFAVNERRQLYLYRAIKNLAEAAETIVNNNLWTEREVDHGNG